MGLFDLSTECRTTQAQLDRLARAIQSMGTSKHCRIGQLLDTIAPCDLFHIENDKLCRIIEDYVKEGCRHAN